MTTGTIYRITNQQNGYCYIGSTLHEKQRLAKHLRHLRKGKHVNKRMQRDFDKYGEAHFTFEILHRNVPEEHLHLYEISEIAAARYNEDPIYNTSTTPRISAKSRQQLAVRAKQKIELLHERIPNDFQRSPDKQ